MKIKPYKINEALAAQLIALEKSLLQPASRHGAAIDNLLADDFVEFASDGKSCGKAEVMAWLRQEKTPDFDASDFQLRWLGDMAALITYTVARGNSSSSASLRSSLWLWQNGSWRMVFHQGTPITKKD